MPDIQHRTVQTNGIDMHIAEMGEGPLVLLCHGFPGVLVLLAAPAPGAGGGRVPRRGAGPARLRGDRCAGGRRRLHPASPRRGHGGPGGGPRRGAGGDRRPRLGRPGRLERGHVASGRVPRGGGALGPGVGPGTRTADGHDEGDVRRPLLLHPVLPDAGRRGARTAARRAGDHAEVPVRRVGQRAARHGHDGGPAAPLRVHAPAAR